MPSRAPRAHKSISPTTVLIAFTLFIFVSCSLINRQVNFYKIVSSRLSDQSWDVYIFTQNWPSSVCLAWEEKHKGNACFAAGNKTSWTIHGIWPTKFGMIGPSFCNSSLPFNPDAIYGIKDQLIEAWAPIEKHKKLNAFWRHEWEKHGTCATTIPRYPDEFEYFNQGLVWSKQYNLTTVLSEAGIVPGRVYNVTNIWNTVKLAFGKNPHISCFTDSISKASYLYEIRICFNKTFDLVDCDGIKLRSQWDYRHRRSGSSNYTDCSPSQLVEYPIVVPTPKSMEPYRTDTVFILELLKMVQFLSWATS